MGGTGRSYSERCNPIYQLPVRSSQEGLVAWTSEVLPYDEKPAAGLGLSNEHHQRVPAGCIAADRRSGVLRRMLDRRQAGKH